jgi:hypothetical protein
MKHIIRKQVIDLSIDNRLDAFAIQHRTSLFYFDDILPALGKAFDDLAVDGQTISIDKLVIDLGRFREIEMHQRYYIDQLLAAITSQVFDKIKVQGFKASARHQASMLSIFRQWLFFIRNGYLPWNISTPDASWYNSVLEAGSVDYESKELLRKLIIEDSRALERLIYQHDPVYLSHIVELLTAKSQSGLEEIVKEITRSIEFLAAKKSLIPLHQKKNIARSIWKEILLIVSTRVTTEVLTTLTIAEQVINENFTNGQAAMISRSATLSKKMTYTGETWKKLTLEAIQKTRNSLPDTLQRGNFREGSTDVNLPEQRKISSDRNEKISSLKHFTRPNTRKEQKQIPKEADSLVKVPSGDADEEIFTSMAGLVILNPFIHPFFRALKVVENGTFMDNTSREKGVLLLHWLATGKVEVAEHELVIAKLLCAYPIAEPIDTSVVLTADETAEAEELLSAVIGQWQILKNTSPAGLREGFIQRNGKISFTNEHHYLQVESSSIDVLLDHLPWNIGYVKLPWMEKFIKVEWR